jgi:hypothetical protein
LAYLIRGDIYSQTGQIDRAMSDYDQAIRLNPNLAVALFNRGLIKRAKGDSAEGDADIAKARQLSPNLPTLTDLLPPSVRTAQAIVLECKIKGSLTGSVVSRAGPRASNTTSSNEMTLSLRIDPQTRLGYIIDNDSQNSLREPISFARSKDGVAIELKDTTGVLIQIYGDGDFFWSVPVTGPALGAPPGLPAPPTVYSPRSSGRCVDVAPLFSAVR